ncbi:MAG: T9SS type A sorting domain-containing protein [Candidatus Eiseniibacteriota bacterium]
MAYRSSYRRGILGAGLLLAGLLAAPLPGSAQIVFDGNIVFGTGNLTQAGQYRTDNMTANCPAAFTTQLMAESAYTNNSYVDPLLTASLPPTTTPNWIPGIGSPAWGGVAGHGKSVNVPADGWFEQTCYTGALDQDPGQDWTQGWTYYDSLGTGRTDIITGRPVRILDNIRFGGPYTMVNDSDYVFRGQIRVLNGGVLRIEPGTVCFGEKSTTGTLIIERRGIILAEGTPTQPIIMTSDDLPGSQVRGSWGGLNILGRARVNCIGVNPPGDVDTCLSEGGAIGTYGGDDDADSSGVLRYVRVEYAGKEITTDNELNSFTFNAVGSRTVLEFLQAHRGSDDGLEFFGGTAQIKRSIATDGTDDGFDWQVGYRGKAQFIILRSSQDLTPSSTGGAGQAGEKGIEADNYEFGFENLPRSNPALANFTIVGDRRSGPGGGNGIQLRRGSAGAILNSIVYNHEQQALRVTDGSTWDATCTGGNFVANPPGLFCSQSVAVTPIAGGNVLLTRGTPNPFRTSLAIRFTLPKSAHVRITMFDASGRLVDTLAERDMEAGDQLVPWDGASSRPAGLYFYRVEAGDLSSQGKVVRAD